MKTFILVLLIKITILFILVNPSSSNNTAAVCNAAVETGEISMLAARNLFTNRQRFLDGYRVRIFILPYSSAITKSFLNNILGLSTEQYKQTINESSVIGKKDRPVMLESVSGIIARVGTTAGGISYLDEDSLIFCDGYTMKILQIVEH